MPLNAITLENVEGFTGQETGVSEWTAIAQEQIDAFAEATGDHQWIHKAHHAASDGPFHGAIAHGLLVLASALKLAQDAGALPQATWIICGYDKVRFRAPVRSGSRVRCRTTVLSACKVGERTLLTVSFTMEVEGRKIPALVADCSLLCPGIERSARQFDEDGVVVQMR